MNTLSAHDHGNCELCDEIDRKLASALEELARLKAVLESAELFVNGWKEQAERAEAELAKLRGHAEAFARCRIKANGYTDWSKEALDEAFAALRADFPKE